MAHSCKRRLSGTKHCCRSGIFLDILGDLRIKLRRKGWVADMELVRTHTYNWTFKYPDRVNGIDVHTGDQ